MNKSELQSKKIADLREIAKAAGISNADELKKPEIINLLVGSQDNDAKETSSEDSERPKRRRKRVVQEDENEQPELFDKENKGTEEKAPEKKVTAEKETEYKKDSS